MKIIYLFIIFIVVALAQILVPIQMIIGSEDTITTGTAYKFKTRPVDPTDPFRGKYITLQYEVNHFNTTDSTYVVGEEIYIYLKKDTLGFAEVSQISKTPLETREDYVKARVTYYYQGKVSFQLPFNTFYMEESKAYDAELAYIKANRDSLRTNVYALVYIKNDKVVLEDVYIDDIPIQEYVEK
ncbi:GDYXXLXY domain-containing protein [Aquimarina sp. 2201CG14-23]|uniref:GDYXXLXY domain-containing protein n=1 Tax=Aquimarina mycalae TaxID=3040073 RepID=UPI0024780072|nr:GDYXXLXY domain-containing protein [Aquimarina sp. 2201CG14-23]MDH7447843.1 GDYXXLXY domain-containing protein [Aquimarina sp. 2201CG14-23]